MAESLRISEIMYHPANTGNPNDPNTEYIELTNIGAEPINLNLVRFTNGIDFTFPSTELSPGGCCLVVKDTAAFEAKYGSALPVAGQYPAARQRRREDRRWWTPSARRSTASGTRTTGTTAPTGRGTL